MKKATLPLTSQASLALILILLMSCNNASPTTQTVTYTDPERGISFQYPINWHVGDNLGIIIASDNSLIEDPRRAGKGQAAVALLLLDYSYTVDNSSLLDLVNLDPSGPPQKEPARLVTFNNQEFAIGTYDVSDPNTQDEANVVAASIFDRRVLIAYLFTAPEDEPTYREIFEEFLGSIQLTQQVTIPFEWPVSPLSGDQIAAVRNCSLETLASERYPQELPADQLHETYPPQTDCDWAVLALAQARRVEYEQPMPEPAKYAFARAVSNNYGFALATPLFYRYFDSLSVTQAPPLAQQPVTHVQISYVSEARYRLAYAVEIRDANGEHPVAGLGDPPLIEVVFHDKAPVQSLATALTDLLPVSSPFLLRGLCLPYRPYWQVTLELEDGASLQMWTSSGLLYSGGPWQTEIEGQNYVQFSTAFARAVTDLMAYIYAKGDILTGLDIEAFHQPVRTYCDTDNVFEQAFPEIPGSTTK